MPAIKFSPYIERIVSQTIGQPNTEYYTDPGITHMDNEHWRLLQFDEIKDISKSFQPLHYAEGWVLRPKSVDFVAVIIAVADLFKVGCHCTVGP